MPKKVRTFPPIRQVRRLPKKAVENEVIFNLANNLFYIGVNIEKEDKENGSSVEKTSV